MSKVYEEIIRGIYIKDSTEYANILVGDYSLIELSLNDLNDENK